jgi:hypothetical protein
MEKQPELCRVNDALKYISRKMETDYFISLIAGRHEKV